MTTYGPTPVTFVSGSGTELVDSEGKVYLDFLSGLAVTSLGHARAEVTQAIAAQAATLTHVSNLFANDQRIRGITDTSIFANARALRPCSAR